MPSLLAPSLGLLHALVDAATVGAVFRASLSLDLTVEAAFLVVFLYDLEAFGSQWLLGLAVDRLKAAKGALALGLCLSAAALLALPASPWVVVALAGLGNALFHLGAGTLTLGVALAAPRATATAPGLFVAPGALGLGFGAWYGRSDGALWPLAAALFVGLMASLAFKACPIPEPAPRPPAPPRTLAWLLPLLLFSIAIRSFVGLGAVRLTEPTEALRWTLPLVAFLGKGLGGRLSDWLGWRRVSVGALLLSAPLLAFGHALPCLLVGLLIFQLTMPVTLTATALALPRHIATAFGLTCLALILGALPTFFAWGRALCVPWLLAALCGLSALALWWALRAPCSRPTPSAGT